ncbi:MAG: MBL fold metallo-hydrolase [Desulfovibrionaceae bacterium]
MAKRGRKMVLILLFAAVVLAAASCVVLNQARFGKAPEGDRLAQVEASPNYADGEFRNRIPTPMLVEGQSTFKIIAGSLFSHKERLRPGEPLPTVRTDLTGPDAMDRDRDVLIWLGHSSYYIQLGGRRILVDPVFSDHAGPFSFTNKTFPGTDIYSADDMPEIDVLLISHDHWDHLDHPTVRALEGKVRTVVCPLGVGGDLEYWGYPREKLHEADWDATVPLGDGLAVTVVPARHYSGRLFARNRTLWAGFVIEGAGRRLLLSGDTGYGPHFAEIARTFGSFDLVALDGGQYDPRWPLIHMTPEQAVRAARELGADAMLPAHVGRFSIAAHPWDEPFIRAVEASQATGVRLLTPRIGEPVRLDGAEQDFPRWWEGLD